MEIGFDTTDVLLLHRVGKPCLLPGDGFAWWYRGHHYRYRSNEEREAYTDGMSSPQFTHALRGLESYGWALPAAVPHDGGFHDGIEVETPDGWRPFTFNKDECDQMLYELLKVLAAGDAEKLRVAVIIYEAVHYFGRTAFNEGRALARTCVLPATEVTS